VFIELHGSIWTLEFAADTLIKQNVCKGPPPIQGRTSICDSPSSRGPRHIFPLALCYIKTDHCQPCLLWHGIGHSASVSQAPAEPCSFDDLNFSSYTVALYRLFFPNKPLPVEESKEVEESRADVNEEDVWDHSSVSFFVGVMPLLTSHHFYQKNLCSYKNGANFWSEGCIPGMSLPNTMTCFLTIN
jgi:hypothetical protein